MNTDNVIRVLIVAALAGVFMGLTAGRWFWKKPVCDHPEIPVFVAYVPTNDLVQIRTNVKRILQEMYDTPIISNIVVIAGTPTNITSLEQWIANTPTNSP